MEIKVVDSSALFEVVGREIVRRIEGATQPCLVLLSGGSAVGAYDGLLELIARGHAGLVMIGLVDERFGSVGHADSNARLIGEAGFWEACQRAEVVYRTILADSTVSQDVERYERWLDEAYHLCPTRIGIFGIGPDGHTAGILPQPVAHFKETFETDRLVVGYASHDQFGERITITPVAIRQLTDAIVVAGGAAKRTVVQRLVEGQNSEPAQFPAALLRSVPRLMLYTDVSLAGL